jgi:hypothetical protein
MNKAAPTSGVTSRHYINPPLAVGRPPRARLATARGFTLAEARNDLALATPIGHRAFKAATNRLQVTGLGLSLKTSPLNLKRRGIAFMTWP